ncbi:MAG: transketolase [Myxococcota bacterium]
MAISFLSKVEADKFNLADFSFGPRRSLVIDIDDVLKSAKFAMTDEEVALWERYDLIYRTLCGILYNFVPTSGHPGGSISSGRFVASLVFHTAEYDFSDPNRKDADMISYAAGHKAMGLYAMWALRTELVRVAHPEMLPSQNLQLRLEDLLGFRRNPTQETPLFKKFKAKPLDGHPSPTTPFIRLSTGASGIGVGASFGLAMGAMDSFRNDPPRVHIVEGEGGMTPGRVHEALAIPSSARLWNTFMHIDWNQASIDSNRVCREGDKPGEYVQWDPLELGHLHDWNVVYVSDGFDFRKVLAAQELAVNIRNHQPTMVVYKTVKGWQYGIEGKKSHGAGHKFCSDEYYNFVSCFERVFNVSFPRFEGKSEPTRVEENFYDTLLVLRKAIESEKEMVKLLTAGIVNSKERLEKRKRAPHESAPKLSKLYAEGGVSPREIPEQLRLKPGDKTTLRGELGKTLNYLNKLTGGAFLASAADLLDSTSVSETGKGFAEGYYDAVSNYKSRLVLTGGICEDAMGSFMSGVAAFGGNIGVSSSYGAFIAALEHISARLHGIGQQSKQECIKEPYNTWIMINAHAGIKTGEDGPTHADPQCLQLLQENFPKGVMITLTPWDPAEIYPLVVAGLLPRPAVLAPFVTRPTETIVDRKALRLPDVTETIWGVYALRRADATAKQYNGTVVLQGSGVTNVFVTEVLPKLDEAGVNMNIFYISSAELFDLLPKEKREEIYPTERGMEAMGISGFTMPTMYRWILSPEGRERTLYPHKEGRYLGSGQAHKVMEEANLHGAGQLKAVLDYARRFEKRGR